MQLSIDQPVNLIVTALLFALATYRMSMLITTDVIFDNARSSFILFMTQKKDGGWHTGIRDKIAYLIGCNKCAGIWVSFILSLIAEYVFGFENLFIFIIFWMSVAGIQTFMLSDNG
jgi:hypothetical protein